MRYDDATKTARVARVDLRVMARRHLPAVVAIDGASFDDPWSDEHYVAVLGGQKAVCVVAEVYDPDLRANVVAGVLVYRRRPDRLRVLRLAVAPKFRRLRVGEALLARVAADLGYLRRAFASLSVSERNLGAQLWLRHNRWVAVSQRRGREGADGTIEFQLVAGRW